VVDVSSIISVVDVSSIISVVDESAAAAAVVLVEAPSPQAASTNDADTSHKAVR
jgi:hypothetical protein